VVSKRQRLEAVRSLARLSRLLERASGDLSLAHYRVLAAVADGDERASRVASRLALGKPAISAAVDALCKRGLLTRDSVESDQRAAALRVTALGKAMLADVDAAMVERLDAVLRHASDADALIAALDQVGPALDRLYDERLAGRVGAAR